jgi:hypothetical protein
MIIKSARRRYYHDFHFMRPIILLLALAFVLPACKRQSGTPMVPVNADMKAHFAFKPGTYWIYKDSVNGEMDSAYVYAQQSEYIYQGCVLFKGEPKYEYLTVFVRVARNNGSLDSERWNLNLMENNCSMACINSADAMESQLSVHLFSWPFLAAQATASGCVLPPDSVLVTTATSSVTVGGQTFPGTARSSHVPGIVDPNLAYNDCFYISPDVGLVKVVFDHPTIPVHRVLELQRSNIIR